MGVIKKKTAVSSLIVLLLQLPISSLQVGYSMANDQLATDQQTKTMSLQTIINNARSGSEVLIEPGIYNGPITINKPLHLIAKGQVTIEGNGTGDVVTLTANGIELKGFTIEHSGLSLSKDNSGLKIKSNKNLIIDNTIIDCLHGIYLYGSSDNTIQNNKIEGIHKLDINDRGNGIHFFHSERNVIDHNVISFTRDGMYFSYSDNNHVTNNFVHDVRYGLHYMYSNKNTFMDNVFTHNTGGSALMYSNGIVLKDNIFENNRGQKGTGIVLNACDDSLIENNKIIDNTRAIFMDMSERITIRNNYIANNFEGIQVPMSSTKNQFYNNTCVANDVPVITENSDASNYWYNPKTKKGNYWDTSEKLDLNGDGISDLPFHLTTVQSYLIGQFPDLRFLEGSPAMKLLDFMYQQFPIIQIPSPVDKFPLMKPSNNTFKG